ncbi:hypothetical protein PV08_09861 [Exophiala spinifera]|uniref:Amidohydrolase-related domain-containing protein n=1 Tax=Exophiala spinifera TaxID=91928 RepID=A0A0D2B114_9EURO|nr:uncharacterized protein PV08_09861 [Exophiala spinifera]KIW12583.1 hypothetical protein PV08_09861 [Exophiala spinifera]
MKKSKLENIILPGKDCRSRWTISLDADTITAINPAETASSSPSSLLLPPLCHPHIHLDKAYILTCNNNDIHRTQPGSWSPDDGDRSSGVPDYGDLAPQSGSFSEALTKTSEAKRRYTPEDLYLRGAQLLGTSLTQGVTACRAFVELDHVTQTLCLEAAISLQASFAGKVAVQICAFAQDPIFSTDHGDENRRILDAALDRDRQQQQEQQQQQGHRRRIGALGTTPYVETSRDASMRNIEWAIETSLEHELNLDFHLDYNLNPDRPAMVWDVIRLLKEARWTERARPDKTIVLGHCTRLTLFRRDEMARLAGEIRDSRLPVHFVGLPTSDLFMMGRPPDNNGGDGDDDDDDEATAIRPRGTMQVLDMIKGGINACLSVNNVGNAFTPWGTGDPISLASLGVGIYQAGTEDDATRLYECVSTRARRAIGLTGVGGSRGDGSGSEEPGLPIEEGRKGDLLLIRNEEWVGCPGHLSMKIPARQRVSVRDVVWDPPDVKLRRIIIPFRIGVQP